VLSLTSNFGRYFNTSIRSTNIDVIKKKTVPIFKGTLCLPLVVKWATYFRSFIKTNNDQFSWEAIAKHFRMVCG